MPGTDKRFEIGQLIVDYSSANIGEIPTDGTTDWNGRLVYVERDLWQGLGEVP